MAHKLAFFFCALLVALIVHSNTQASAVRDLPLEEEVIEQILVADLTNKKGCYNLCKSDANCNNRGSECRQCRTAHNHYDITMRCYPRI